MYKYRFVPEEPIRVAVLGSTGSIGTQTLDALSHKNCRFVMLSAGRNAELAAAQARKYSPNIVTMEDEDAASSLRLLLAGENVKIYSGKDAVPRGLEECGAEFVLHSIAGLAGLPSALAAARLGIRIGMANKEAVIAAGDTIFSALRSSGGALIPVDSEHSAIFQCLHAAGAASLCGQTDTLTVRRILLTASGGPFFGKCRNDLHEVTPAQALAHPTWKMGAKITVDSATLMNKGFEIMEAVRLFGVPEEKIEVLVHRQSVVHSMVEFADRSVIAQLAQPDMRGCIRYALTYPLRPDAEGESLDFTKLHSLTFDAPDLVTFPLLTAAREAIRRGGTAPAALIAADEEAVAAFLAGRIALDEIADVVMETMAVLYVSGETDEAALEAASAEARTEAARRIAMISSGK